MPASVRSHPLELALVVALAVGCGLSPFRYALYNLGDWGLAALALLALVLAVAIARPARPSAAALVALAGLVALAALALASAGWGASPGGALIEGDRWIAYAALLALLMLTVKGDRVAVRALEVYAAVAVAVALYVLVRMIAGDAAPLFLAKRLNQPLGYVNGQASYFLLGIWPLVAVGERARGAWTAAGALAGAVLLACVAVLGETRAVVPAVAVSAIAVVALVPGRARRGWAVAFVAGGVAAAAPSLLRVYSEGGTTVAAAPARQAAVAALLAAAAAGAVWALARRFAGGRRAGAVLAALGVVLVVAAAVAVGHPVRRISDQVSAFTTLRSSAGARNRFLSGGGNRYDYWRVAVAELRSEPLHGVGAGSYRFDYYQRRRTAEDVQQPHSLELQALAELGIAGALALLLFVGAAIAGMVRVRRDAPLAVAAGGTFLVWLVHGSVDWIQLLPGLTAVALIAAAALLGRGRLLVGGRGRWAVAGAAAVMVALAAVPLARATLADRYERQARSALLAHPRVALAKASRTLALNGDSVTAYYVVAAARARLGDYYGARAALLAAIRLEPRNYATWALLGDIALRHGDRRLARADYSVAHRLNPRDASVSLRR